MAKRPRDAVFTTVLWDGNSKIADFDHHITRLNYHAERLRIDLPKNSEQLIAQTILNRANKYSDNKLLNITFDCISREFKTHSRELPNLRNCNIDAMTIPIKKWLGQVTGTKHGDWQFYIEAKDVAEQNGVDIALLIDQYSIIDSDRASIMVIDEDGVAYISESQQAVQGITLEVLTNGLAEMGIPLNKAKLNERLVARCTEIIALGTGIGCCKIISIDGDEVGQKSSTIFNKCQAYLAQHYSNTNNWTDLCEYSN